MLDLVLSITVLAAIILFAGAIVLWRKGGHSRQAMLMAILAFVMLANVAIWVGPAPEGSGDGPAQEAAALP